MILLHVGNARFRYTARGLAVHVITSEDKTMCGRSGPFRTPLHGAWFELAPCRRCAGAAIAAGFTHVVDGDGVPVALAELS